MHNQNLIEMLHEIGEPDDYFEGVHRPREMLPDNILVFSRSDGASLSSGIIPPDLHQRWVLIISLLGRGNVKIDCSCDYVPALRMQVARYKTFEITIRNCGHNCVIARINHLA
jgi:hypothetical protein